MKSFLALFFFVQGVLALIEWPFEGKSGQPILLNLTIGTPGQLVPISFQMAQFESQQFTDSELYVATSTLYEKGFDLTKSSTFTKIDALPNKTSYLIEATGLDDFVFIGKNNAKQLIKQIPFAVESKDENVFEYSGQLTLMRSTNGNSFLETVLKQQEEQIVVATFDNIPSKPDEIYTGQLTLGGRPEVCSKKWTMVPEVNFSNGKQWNLMLDSFKIGNFSHKKPVTAFLWSDSPWIELTREAYYQFLDTVGADRDEQIPCNSTQKISIEIGGKEMELNIGDYLDNWREDYVEEDEWSMKFMNSRKKLIERCPIRLRQSHRNLSSLELPISLLRDQCVMWDFKGKQLGFADKKKL